MITVQEAVDQLVSAIRQEIIEKILSGDKWANVAAPSSAAPEKVDGRRGPRKGKRKQMSPEARAKIAAAQKARWAKINAAKKK